MYHDVAPYINNPDYDLLEKETQVLIDRLHEELDEEECQPIRELLELTEKFRAAIVAINN